MRMRRRSVLLALGATVVMASNVVQPAFAEDLQKVTYAIATADINVGYPFATLAKGLGYFEEEGLDVSIVPGQSSATVTQLLLSGRADVGLMNPYAASTQTANNGVPLVAFYPVSRAGTTRIVVPADGSIKSMADFKGKTIGVLDLGSSEVAYFKSRLRQEGVPENSVSIIATGYGTPTFEAFKSGRIDGFVTFHGGFIRMLAAGYKGDSLPLPAEEEDLYSFTLYGTKDYVSNHGDILGKLGRATAKATVFLMTNPEAAVRMFWKQFPDRAPKDPSDPKALAADLAIVKAQIEDMKADTLPATFAWGSQTADVYQKIQDFLIGTGEIKKPVDPNVFFTSDFEKTYVDFDVSKIVEQAKNWSD